MAQSHDSVVESARKLLVEGELARRFVHASGTTLPALYLAGFLTWTQVSVLFVLGAAVTVVLETIRLSIGLDWFIYDYLTREYEEDSIAGYMLYMISAAPVAVVFGPEIAVPATLMLTLGDPISGMIGSGELQSTKRPPALAAMFCICALIALPFVPPIAVVLGGIAGMFADGVKPVIGDFVVDDNLTIPPAAAVAMQAGIELTAVL